MANVSKILPLDKKARRDVLSVLARYIAKIDRLAAPEAALVAADVARSTDRVKLLALMGIAPEFDANPEHATYGDNWQWRTFSDMLLSAAYALRVCNLMLENELGTRATVAHIFRLREQWKNAATVAQLKLNAACTTGNVIVALTFDADPRFSQRETGLVAHMKNGEVIDL